MADPDRRLDRFDRFDEVDALFSAALALDPAERGAFLGERCGGDPELRAAVERLLASAEEEEGDPLRPGGALDAGLWTELAGEIDAGGGLAGDLADTLSPGDRVGPYRVEDEIGRGGMAVVYRARRVDGGFEQQVALKLIKRGVDTSEVLRRFAQERQILATLDHPDIARLLDGGVTADGRPYFALELVEGRPIDRWCEERALSLRARLRLFLGVCRAVQHAHRRLVVHRDLKPSNLLVTAEGRVKLLDFGIAKLVDPDPWPEVAPTTRATLRMLTPEYASPEQVRGAPVTTATDVYQLGLLLYELLTGRRALQVDSATPAALERAICERDPTPPSTAVTRPTGIAGLGGGGSYAARLRRLKRSLRGDLDNIVLTALRKEPERRYGSAGELAADVERYLDGRPVMARRDTVGYRTAKFVRRHRWALAAAAAVVVTAVALTAVYTVHLARERDRAQREAERSARIAEALSELLLVADPDRAQAETIPARTLLDRGVVAVRRDLAGQPDLRASLLHVLGRAYSEMGVNQRATDLLEEALELRRRLLGDDHRDTAAVLSDLGQARFQAGDLATASTMFERALAIEERESAAGGGDPAALGRVLARLANVRKRTGDLEASRSLFERALAVLIPALGPGHDQVGRTRSHFGLLLDALGDTEGARRELEASLAIMERVFGPDHPRTAGTLGNLVYVRAKLGDDEGSLAAAQRVVEIHTRTYGLNDTHTAGAYSMLAYVIHRQGDHERAVEAYARSVASYEAARGPDHHIVAFPLTYLARELRHVGRHQEAWPLYERALAIRRATLGVGHALVGVVLAEQGEWCEETGDAERAEALYRRALDIRRAALPAGHPEIGSNLALLGALIAGRGACAEAAPLLTEAVGILRTAGSGAGAGNGLAAAEAALAHCG